jgi:3-oxoacyl-[acyl-carrier protein] reductase
MPKTVLITGASRGLGKVLASLFSEKGYNLILHHNNTDLPLPKGVVGAVKGDLTSTVTRFQLAKLAMENDLDILINNAGVHVRKLLIDMKPEEIKTIINVNLLGTLLLAWEIWPIFVEKKAGQIINVNSIAGVHGSSGESAYCASKFGLRGFVESLAQEAIEHNINIVDVFLYAMKTDMTKHRLDHDNLINPMDAAHMIYGASKEYPSAQISDITISRSNY